MAREVGPRAFLRQARRAAGGRGHPDLFVRCNAGHLRQHRSGGSGHHHASPKDGIVKFQACLRPEVTIHEVDTWRNSMPREPEVIAAAAGWLESRVQTAPGPKAAPA